MTKAAQLENLRAWAEGEWGSGHAGRAVTGGQVLQLLDEVERRGRLAEQACNTLEGVIAGPYNEGVWATARSALARLRQALEGE